MEKIFETFRRKINATNTDFLRSLENKIHWESRLICIRGARGTGKTTLLLQHIKTTFAENLNKVLYVSLDNLWFSEHTLLELADTFVKKGGTHLFLDEVHKYPDWSIAIKNLYDDYSELNIVFTGSSLLEILNARADLSRRAVVYSMQGLSFREYLTLKTHHTFDIFSLDDILSHNEDVSASIVSKIKPFEFFEEYLKTGYYPYFLEGDAVYQRRLEETVSMILEVELPLLRNVEIAYVQKLRKLLYIISESAPFLPNITKLAERIGITRQTLLLYLQYLRDAKLISLLYQDARGISALQKPDKIFLENTNLMHLAGTSFVNKGSERETFAQNQLAYEHFVEFSPTSDFFVDSKYTFEIGGKNKTQKQIQNTENAFVIADDIEYGTNRRIPLWLLGFMY